MKKNFPGLAKKVSIIFFVFYGIVSFAACRTIPAALQMPVISLHSAEFTDINLGGAQLLCKVQIENPNSFEIPFPEIDWELFLNTNSFITGIVKNDQRIRARETVIVEVPVGIIYLDLFNAFASLRGQSQADYKVALAVKFPIPVVGNRVWDIAHEGDVPIPRPPIISSPVMRVEKVDSTMVELYVSVNVENPNPFELPVPRINFDYHVNDTSILRHRLDSRRTLASSSVTPVVFGLIVYYTDLFRILPALRTSINAPSMLYLSFDFSIPAFSTDSFNLQIPGSLPLTGR